MRDYRRFDKYIEELHKDVYEQPESEGHTQGIRQLYLEWVFPKPDIQSVLDVGCGRGEGLDLCKQYAKECAGVTIGPDYKWIKEHKPYLTTYEQDMNFMEFSDNSFDAIVCRHSLEHSFMPLITLKEFHRISKKYVFIVIPPMTIGVVGDNHYSILSDPMWQRLFDLAGFDVVARGQIVDPVIEIRYELTKRSI